MPASPTKVFMRLSHYNHGAACAAAGSAPGGCSGGAAAMFLTMLGTLPMSPGEACYSFWQGYPFKVDETKGEQEVWSTCEDTLAVVKAMAACATGQQKRLLANITVDDHVLLQDNEADGPDYYQGWEGRKLTSPICGMNALFVAHFTRLCTSNPQLLKLFAHENVLVGGVFVISACVQAYISTMVGEHSAEEKNRAQHELFFLQETMGYYPVHFSMPTIFAPMCVRNSQGFAQATCCSRCSSMTTCGWKVSVSSLAMCRRISRQRWVSVARRRQTRAQPELFLKKHGLLPFAVLDVHDPRPNVRVGRATRPVGANSMPFSTTCRVTFENALCMRCKKPKPIAVPS